MIETGDGAAAYYTDIMQTVVNLALAAPGGPPRDAASFLDRLDTAWLESAYGDGAHEAAMIRIRAARPHLGDIQLRYATLLGLIRTLEVGQVCYIHHGGATFVQVARPKPSPLPLSAARAPSVIIQPPAPSPAEEQTAPSSESLEDVLGPGAAR